jgi:hypothetical protein
VSPGFYIPDDGILHIHRSENLKSYNPPLIPKLYMLHVLYGGVVGQTTQRLKPQSISCQCGFAFGSLGI